LLPSYNSISDKTVERFHDGVTGICHCERERSNLTFVFGKLAMTEKKEFLEKMAQFLQDRVALVWIIGSFFIDLFNFNKKRLDNIKLCDIIRVPSNKSKLCKTVNEVCNNLFYARKKTIERAIERKRAFK